MSAWVDNVRSHEGARHLIDSAVFELSFGREMADWANEPQSVRIVETELMAVIDEVFDEVASTSDAVQLDSLEIDLGSIRYDGTWNDARERLRDLLHAALDDAVLSTEAKGVNGQWARAEELQAPAQLDVVAHFLLYGSLPTGARVRDGSSMESLLRTKIRSEPRRLADLIIGTSSGGVVASRLARQFSDSVLEQIVGVFNPRHAALLVTFARGLRRVATERGSPLVWRGEIRSVLWARLLTALAAASPPQIDLLVETVLEESAGSLGLTLRELARRLSSFVADSEESVALIRRLASDTAPLFPGIDDLVAGIERGQADIVELALEKLRSGDLPLAVLSDRLGTVGHRRLLAGVLEATGQKPEGTSELGKAIESYARRSGSAKGFYRQVLERLVAGDLVDLEAIYAQSQRGQHHDQRQGSAESPRTEDVTEPHAEAESSALQEARAATDGGSNGDTAQALALYLRAGARTLGVDRQRLMDVAEHLLRRAPDRAIDLLRQALSGADEAAVARLVELLPERLLARALYLLAPTVHARVQRYTDVVASTFQELGTEIGVALVSTLKWQYRFRYLLTAAGEMDDAGLVDGLVAYLASHAAGPDAGELSRQMRARFSESAPWAATVAEQAPQVRTDEAARRDSERTIRGYDLYSRLAQHLGGEAAPGLLGNLALPQIIDELARDYPEQLHRIFQELRQGVLNKLRATRLSGKELRALVQAFLSLPPASGQTERTQLGRSIDEHAERAGSTQAFYGQVLQRLVNGELIDLEAIGAASQSGQRPRATPLETEQAGRIRTDQASRRDSASANRGDDLYAQLAHHLGGAAAPGTQVSLALTQVIDELARGYPKQLQRIFLELREGALEKLRVLHLSGMELRALVQAFLSLPLASEQTDRSQLGRSIDEHAERASNAQAFYGQVLQRLMDGGLIDLEAIGTATRSGRYRGASLSEAEQAAGKAERRGAPLQHAPASSASENTGEADRALTVYLREGASVPGTARQILMNRAEVLLGQAPERAGSFLRESLVDEAAATRLVELLPERLLARALYALAPAAHARVLRYADVVAGAFQRIEAGLDTTRIKQLKWQFCFRYLGSVGHRVDFGELVHGLVEYLVSHAGHSGNNELRSRLREQLAASTLPSTDNVALRAARILAFEDSVDLPAAAEPSPDNPPVPDIERDLEVLGEGIRVANAGQVIASPYLPRLFGMLDLVEEGSFKSPKARERAVHLLQFMVDEADDSAEYDLVLNKVLCGLDTAMPICRGISVSADEKTKIEGLLGAMIQHWKILGNTSVGGLRESFLQREGTLRPKSDGWHLSVEPKAFDMLLDRIPWSFSTIKHPWMKEVLHVTWR